MFLNVYGHSFEDFDKISIPEKDRLVSYNCILGYKVDNVKLHQNFVGIIWEDNMKC